MIKKMIISGIATSALLFTGCGGGSSIGGSTSTPAVTAVVQIDNKTTTDMYQLYIKSSSVSSWGDDLLTGSTFIKGLTKVDFETHICNKLIDIKVTGSFGSPVSIVEQVQLDCGKTFVYKIVN